jgi:rhodanese-related sulfurtransferase
MTRMRSDLSVILAVFAASCMLGMLTNSLRRASLPMGYENPEVRMLRSISSGAGLISREPEALEFQAVLQAWKDSSALFVDARETAFFEEGHIPLAINLPQEEILRAKTIRELSDKSRPVIVYCSGEDCEDSKLVAKGLLALGHSKVSVYAEGWEEWSASGSPIEK